MQRSSRSLAESAAKEGFQSLAYIFTMAEIESSALQDPKSPGTLKRLGWGYRPLPQPPQSGVSNQPWQGHHQLQQAERANDHGGQPPAGGAVGHE